MNGKVSIIIPTFNSAKTLEGTLVSIKKQEYPEKLIEVLIVDGGSKDKTRKIARKYGYKVLNNPLKQQEHAKSIGFQKALGEFVLFLDSDEELVFNKAIMESVNAVKENELMLVLQTGYEKPKGISSVNDYINLFSDPFAHFVYGTSSDWRNKIISWEKRYKNYINKKNLVIFKFYKNKPLPLIDMAAGTLINKDRIFKSLPSNQLENKLLITKLFYLINKLDNRVGIIKNSPVLHFSADSYNTFLKKIRWRVRANVHYKDIPGTGFSNREDFQPLLFRLKKYLFLPYSLTLIIPLIESIYYAIKYKKSSLLLHLPLTIFTTLVIICEYFLLLIGSKPKLRTYGKN